MNCFLHNLGLINALGSGQSNVRSAMAAADRRGLYARNDLISGRTIKVAEISNALPVWPADAWPQYASRNNQLLLAAAEQIQSAINQTIETFDATRVGIVLGSSTSGIRESEIAEETYVETGHFPAEYHYSQQEIASPSEFLARYLQVKGPAFTISTACTSSTKAFASARRLLALNLCDAVIVGGADSLCRLTVNGFNALESLSAEGCNPFSRLRNGITIGEAAALFILRRDEGPVRLCGIGESSDAHHISAPDPQGRGAESAMRGALSDAGIAPNAIEYINLHGTGTHLNDHMESHAVARVFGQQTACSSSKAQLGHTLGAAGATEAALCWLMLTDKARRLPPHVWDGNGDSELPKLAFCRAETTATRTILSNSFAFGGSNACLVLEAA